MCDKCKVIDDEIARYQRLRINVIDKQTLDGIDQLIKEREARKKALHPD